MQNKTINGKPNAVATFWGARVEAFFFDPVNEGTTIEKNLPFIPADKHCFYNVVALEEDKMNIKYGDIVAQPDAVFSFIIPFKGREQIVKGHICLEYKSLAGERPQNRLHSVKQWRNQIRAKDFLQTIICAMQVSVKYNSSTMPVLKYVNSAYVIYPSRELIEFIINKAPKVKSYLEKNDFVSASELANKLSDEVITYFKKENAKSEKAKLKGQEEHNRMLS